LFIFGIELGYALFRDSKAIGL